MKAVFAYKGGKGSGFFGHLGRPGKQGVSSAEQRRAQADAEEASRKRDAEGVTRAVHFMNQQSNWEKRGLGEYKLTVQRNNQRYRAEAKIAAGGRLVGTVHDVFGGTEQTFDLTPENFSTEMNKLMGFGTGGREPRQRGDEYHW